MILDNHIGLQLPKGLVCMKKMLLVIFISLSFISCSSPVKETQAILAYQDTCVDGNLSSELYVGSYNKYLILRCSKSKVLTNE